LKPECCLRARQSAAEVCDGGLRPADRVLELNECRYEQAMED
jgi:hypothetical protein